MKKVILSMSVALVLIAMPSAAQTGNDKPKTTEQVKADVEKTQAIKTQVDTQQALFNQRFPPSLANVQIELTLTDQIGSSAPEKKTVSMIVTNGSLGKVRTAGSIRPQGDSPYAVMLNVDARPNVSTEGAVRLELTIEYYPMKGAGEEKEGAKQRPSGINQSQTVVLQSGRPLVISQAADPISDRKVIVEVKATVLK